MTNKGFNEFSLLQLKKYGLIAEIVRTSKGNAVLQFNMPSGRNAGFAGPAKLFKVDEFSAATRHLNDADRLEFFQGDESCYSAARSLKAWAIQQKTIADASANLKLSPDGKAEIAVAATLAAIGTVGRQYTSLVSIKSSLDQREAKLYAYPEASAADAPVDVALQDRFRRHTEAEQIQLALKLGEPSMQRVLLALRRSGWPIGGVVGDSINEAWSKQVALISEEAVALYQIERDNNTWAIDLTKFIAGFVMNDSVSITAGEISTYDYFKILNPIGAIDLLGLDATMQRMYERRQLEAAA